MEKDRFSTVVNKLETSEKQLTFQQYEIILFFHKIVHTVEKINANVPQSVDKRNGV